MKKIGNDNIKSYGLAAVAAAIVIAGLFLVRSPGQGGISANTVPKPDVVPQSLASAATGSAVPVAVDANGKIAIKELGIAMDIAPELAAQGGLLAVLQEDASQSSKTVSFTTKELADNNPKCDGVQGWIGRMTHFEGPAASMGEAGHAHDTANFDFTGFHINYQNVQDSCVAGAEGYSSDQLGKETVAARKLWDMMQGAQGL